MKGRAWLAVSVVLASCGSAASIGSGEDAGGASPGPAASATPGPVGDSSGGSSGAAAVPASADASDPDPGAAAVSDAGAGDAGLPICGMTPCDLRTQTCCVGVGAGGQATGQCLAGATASCPAGAAAFHCAQAADCSSGEVCCGVLGATSAVVACQAVPDGGSCSPPSSATQLSAQLCRADAECKNGEACIMQTCAGGAVLALCGLQSQPPFRCAPR